MRNFLNDENGFVVSAELMLVITLMFCAAAVGWGAVKDSLANELNDVSHAIGSVSQSYNVTGFEKDKRVGKPHAECSGFGYNDKADDCDCNQAQVALRQCVNLPCDERSDAGTTE